MLVPTHLIELNRTAETNAGSDRIDIENRFDKTNREGLAPANGVPSHGVVLASKSNRLACG